MLAGKGTKIIQNINKWIITEYKGEEWFEFSRDAANRMESILASEG